MIDTRSLFDLGGRVALVTGGSRGIGRMIAEGLAGQGAKVYVSARSVEDCERTARELTSAGARCVALPGDLGDVAGARALAERLAAVEPVLDVLVNNAGAAWAAPLAEFPEHGWDRAMDLNVKSPFFLTQALLDPLTRAARARGTSKVINIASVDAFANNPWETYSYHASKAALVSLTRRMAAQLAPDGIVVSAIAPGAFPSQMNRAARDMGDAVAAHVPVGRIGTPEDMAAAAIFLAARSGDYVVGETLVVDGGVVHAGLGPEIERTGAAKLQQRTQGG